MLRGAGAAGVISLTGCAAAGAERPTLVATPPPTAFPPRFGRQVRAEGQAFDTAEPARELTTPEVDPHRSVIGFTQPAQIEVFSGPSESADVTHVMDNPTTTGGQLVFLTINSTRQWQQVLLPVRPNGSTGWVRTSDLALAEHFYRIQVDLADFRMRVFENGQPIFDTVVGVAANNTPTPGGLYYLTELLAPATPTTAYGAFAYGLSGYSEVFETFNGGPGQLGIHGTNDPDTLGTPVSAGCIRLHNEDISRLVDFLPLGVPVSVA